jgi:hypothetical protein
MARQRISTFKNGRFEGAVGVPVLLVDGVVSGVWERRRRGKRVEIHVQPFVRLTPAQRVLLDQAVERIGSFLESPVAVTIDPAE